MKKFRLCALSLLVALSMTACGDDLPGDTSAAGETTSVPVQTDGGDPSAPASTSASTSSPTTDPDDSRAPADTTRPGIGGDDPAVGEGIFDGMGLQQIWDQIMSTLADSAGFDVSVTSSSEYTVDGESQTEEQSVQILFNTAKDGYSYSIQTQTDRVVDGENLSESLWQAYKDGWFYQSANSGKTEVSGRIAIDEDALAGQKLNAQAVLALNSMLDTENLTIDGIDGGALRLIFKKVTFGMRDGGGYQITCQGINTDKLMELISEQTGDTEVSGDLGALVSGVAQILDAGLEIEISDAGVPTKITSDVSVSMTEPMAFSVSTRYTLIINAIGEGAGTVSVPEEAAGYPVYESYKDYLSVLNEGTEQE